MARLASISRRRGLLLLRGHEISMTLARAIVVIVSVIGVVAATELLIQFIWQLPFARQEQALFRRIAAHIGGRYCRPLCGRLPQVIAERGKLTIRVEKLTSPYELFSGTVVTLVGVDLGIDPPRLILKPEDAAALRKLPKSVAGTLEAIRRLGDRDTEVAVLPAKWPRQRARVLASFGNLPPDDPHTEQRIIDLIEELKTLAEHIRRNG